MDDGVKCGGAERGSRRLDAAFWRDSLAPYAKPDLRRSVFDIATSVLAYLALTAVMYAALDVSRLLVVVLAVPAAGFLMRTFIVFHDCAHGSFRHGGVRTTGWGRVRAARLFALSRLASRACGPSRVSR
jgi:omega-6 fatty acid desaturase (delta-12 desaturase)